MISSVFTDLTGAAQTAAVIGTSPGVEAALNASLQERSYGVAEGRPQPWPDVRIIFPPGLDARREHDDGIEGGVTHWGARLLNPRESF